MNDIIVALMALCIALSIGCSRHEVTNKTEPVELDSSPMPEETRPPIYVHISSMMSEELCDRLISIDTMPGRDPNITDPIYESLILKGNEAVPCLIDKIDDTTPMPDPRYSVPHWQNFKVGDTAVFILLTISSKDDDDAWEENLLKSLPPKNRAEWKTNGIYAYFNYVSEPQNRKELRKWWLEWAKDNLKKQ